jgi:hypothetical protein
MHISTTTIIRQQQQFRTFNYTHMPGSTTTIIQQQQQFHTYNYTRMPISNPTLNPRRQQFHVCSHAYTHAYFHHINNSTATAIPRLQLHTHA